MSYKKRVLNYTLFSGLSVYLESFVGLVISILIARQLGAEHYGIYSVIILTASLGVTLANGGLKTAVIKFMAEARGKNEYGVGMSAMSYVLRIQKIFIPSTMIFLALGFYLFSEKIVAPEHQYLLGLALIAVTPKAFQLFYISAAKGMESFKSIFFINATVTPVNLLVVIYIVLTDGGLNQFLWGYLGISFLYHIVSWFWVRNNIRHEANDKKPLPEEFRRRMNQFVLIATVNSFLAFIIGREIEIVFLNLYGYTAEAGYYKIAFSLAETAIILVPGIFGAVLLPVMAKSLGESADIQAHRFRESGRFMIMLAAPIITLGVVFADALIELLYGSDFHQAVMPLRVLLIFFGFTMLNQLSASILLSHDRQGTVTKVMIITAAINIGLDIILIKEFILVGAVTAGVITKVILAITYQVLVSKILDTKLPYLSFVHIYALAIIAIIPIWIFYYFNPEVWILALGAAIYLVLYVLMLLMQFMVSKTELELFKSLFSKYAFVETIFKSRFFSWIDRRYDRKFGTV